MNTGQRNERYARTHILVEATLATCQRLLNALRDERTALESDDSSALADAGSRKQIHLAQLQRHESNRQQLLASYRCEADLEAMRKFIEGFDGNGELMKVWNATIALLAQCRDTNNTNGTIVALRRRQVSEALRILRAGEEVPETYGPEGKKESTGQFRALAQV